MMRSYKLLELAFIKKHYKLVKISCKLMRKWQLFICILVKTY